jgi:hypothetical protein
MENGQEWKSWRENAPVEVDLTLFLCSQPNFIIPYIIIQEKKQTNVENNKVISYIRKKNMKSTLFKVV